MKKQTKNTWEKERWRGWKGGEQEENRENKLSKQQIDWSNRIQLQVGLTSRVLSAWMMGWRLIWKKKKTRVCACPSDSYPDHVLIRFVEKMLDVFVYPSLIQPLRPLRLPSYLPTLYFFCSNNDSATCGLILLSAKRQCFCLPRCWHDFTQTNLSCTKEILIVQMKERQEKRRTERKHKEEGRSVLKKHRYENREKRQNTAQKQMTQLNQSTDNKWRRTWAARFSGCFLSSTS